MPDKVSCGSNRPIWWMCGRGHEWQASAKNRMKGQGCPFCSNKRVKAGDNDLQSRYPELALEWNREKNDGLRPDGVVYGSHKAVWWRCAKGHEWRAAVVSRTQGSNCPYCSNKRILPGENDLQTLNPGLAAQWNPAKNGVLISRQVSPGSNKKVWWKCTWGHEWKATVVSRVQGNGCPVCAKARNISFPEKTIVYYLKDIFSDLQENANKSLLPWLGKMEIDIYIPSLKLGIEYDGPQHLLVSDQRKNTICCRNGIQLIRIRDDRLSHHPEGSVNILNKNRDDSSLENAVLEILKHVYQMYSVAVEADVNIERDRTRILCLMGVPTGKASASGILPDIAEEWNYEKNSGLKPENFTAGSNRKVWWKCGKGHAWQATIVARQGGSGCPYCTNKKVLAGFNDLASQNPELTAQWHPVRNGIKPTEITLHSGKKVWWQCKKGHEWQASADCRSRGQNCPYCSNRRVLQGYNDLQTKDPRLAEQWHPTGNGELKACDITLHSNRMVWWQCERGHEWKAIVHNRAKGAGCPVCYRNSFWRKD